MKDAPLLDAIWAVNFFLGVNAVTKKFRLLASLKVLFIRSSLIATLPKILALNHSEVVTRIERRGITTHLDYFDQVCPPGAPEPNKKQLKHMEIVAGQLLSAGYEPISSQFLCTLIFLAQDKESYRYLVREIRDEFKADHEINTETVAHLPVLNASLTETFAYDRDRRERLASYQSRSSRGQSLRCKRRRSTVRPFRIHSRHAILSRPGQLPPAALAAG